jgi:hypothetical protein
LVLAHVQRAVSTLCHHGIYNLDGLREKGRFAMDFRSERYIIRGSHETRYNLLYAELQS